MLFLQKTKTVIFFSFQPNRTDVECTGAFNILNKVGESEYVQKAYILSIKVMAVKLW